MDKRDLGITIGICASLAVHMGALTYSAHKYAQTSLYYPATAHALPGVLVSLKPKVPVLLPPPPPPPPDPREDVGSATGTGESDFPSPGNRPLEAPKADETQALYTLQSPGQRIAPDRTGHSENSAIGDNGRGGPRARAAQALADAVHQIELPPQKRPAPKPIADPPDLAKPQPLPTPAPPPAPPPLALTPSLTSHLLLPSAPKPMPDAIALGVPVPPAPKVPTPPTPTTPPVRTASGDGRQPGAAANAGNPAPHNDTDSDPFSKTGTVIFHNGHVSQRFGRAAKFKDPDLTTAEDWDTVSDDDPTVVLKISIDETGDVSGADIVSSSGSSDLDLATQKAVEQWWFEPRKDAKGRTVTDVIVFTVKYR